MPALIRLMNDPSDEVRTAAVGSIGHLRAVEAIDALTEQLSAGNPPYRQKVAYALGQIAGMPGAGSAGEEAMRTLVANLAAADQRNGAKEALRVAGKAAVLWGQTAQELAGSAADLAADLGAAAVCVAGQVAGVVAAVSQIQARFEVSIEVSAQFSATAGAQ